MQQRDEKQLEFALDNITRRVNDLKTAIANMIVKIETEPETLNWPNFLVNYALIAGQLTALTKVLSQDKCPLLRNLALLPLMLCPDRDEQLAQKTEGRVPIFAHDLVPDYLRTKLEPSAESKMLQIENKAANLTTENAQKQIGSYQKVVRHVLDIVEKAREEWDVESTRSNTQPSYSQADTNLLVVALGMGKGLRMVPNHNSGNPASGGMMVTPQNRGGSGSLPIPSNTQSAIINKIASTIKTNIKSGQHIHPYRR